MIGPYDLTATERAVVQAADRRGAPYLLLRAGSGRLVLHELTGDVVTIGRDPENDLALEWDGEVSRAHARVERQGGRWTVADDGMSRNGTFVGQNRIGGRKVLEGGDAIRVGQTVLVFRASRAALPETVTAEDAAAIVELTPAEGRVLAALCRPVLEEGPPATNAEIAAELVLTVAGVKTHLRSLFTKLAVDDLAQNRKRAALARRAINAGLVRR